MFASLLLLGAVAVLVAAGLLLNASIRLRGKVKRADWMLTRVVAALGEAERAGRVRRELADS